MNYKIVELPYKKLPLKLQELVLRKITTVSGMAIGTDTIVHKETIKNNGNTIAILGYGFNSISSRESQELFKSIIENNGLVFTEYAVDVKTQKSFFLERNRLITAISEGVLVIEAGYRSGTSITAKKAKEQGKLVFAVPSSIDSTVGIGTNNLLKKGAIVTTEIKDVLSRYPQFANRKRINVSQRTNPINSKDKVIALVEKEGKSIEEIASVLNKNIGEVFKLLSKMEIENIVCQDFYGKYKLVKGVKNK